MRVVFMGTPVLAATVLASVADKHEVVGVFTRPDAVRGRGKKLVPSPVKEEAEKRGIPVFTAKSMKGADSEELVRSLAPDVICVAAYGSILPPEILQIPKYGCLNVHTSLLPRWRGAAPIEHAILARDAKTGVCIMKMEEGLDTGAYCIRESVDVDRMYVSDLAARLAEAGAQGLLKALDLAESGKIEWTEQAYDGVTYAGKIEKGELDILPTDAAADADAKVRASNASHPSRLSIDGRPLAVERASIVGEDSPLHAAGLKEGQATVIAKRLVIGVADGMLELEQVKPDGKKSMEGRAFAAGLQSAKGALVNWGRA